MRVSDGIIRRYQSLKWLMQMCMSLEFLDENLLDKSSRHEGTKPAIFTFFKKGGIRKNKMSLVLPQCFPRQERAMSRTFAAIYLGEKTTRNAIPFFFCDSSK